MTLADRIVVLNDGLIEQVGSPSELYDSPANIFVAGFIGSPKMNFFKAEVGSVGRDEVVLASPTLLNGKAKIAVKTDSRLKPGEQITLGVRPSSLILDPPQPILAVTTDVTENLGGETQIYGKTGAGDPVVWLAPGRPGIKVGSTLRLGAAKTYLFDHVGKAL
jgi:lactose/L-arabinose transport system ATP-binding protein